MSHCVKCYSAYIAGRRPPVSRHKFNASWWSGVSNELRFSRIKMLCKNRAKTQPDPTTRGSEPLNRISVYRRSVLPKRGRIPPLENIGVRTGTRLHSRSVCNSACDSHLFYPRYKAIVNIRLRPRSEVAHGKSVSICAALSNLCCYLATGESLLKIMAFFRVAPILDHYVQIWRHSPNRKYITYRNAAIKDQATATAGNTLRKFGVKT